ncbi:MAG: glucose-6-phosphate isomerase [Tenuifilum sp.]|jgi:glucose-6-phosphate isomerase|uniref:glucose-6-phosphate isomerase n=1 Tax=Tenuifilum sp. TaxID=2760880 RepID=UPI0024AB4C08|nr:glucose-6-phosphate isomerase [Tenuifilum sp.]MDI3526172.1 glucose-6-phosphate isomerase [Tenuifilum sp.]
MSKLEVKLNNMLQFASEQEVMSYREKINLCQKQIEEKSGKGNDFLGWVNLPAEITEEQLKSVEKVAAELRGKSEIVVVVGIGGSYLGAKAVIEALGNSFSMLNDTGTKVLFAGNSICEDYHAELLKVLDKHSYSIVVISKSGTTTEPAIAFRLLKQHLESKVGKSEAASRIVAITDQSKGALRKLADTEGYRTFIIPDDVGGRYSVLTPVGLLPIAIAGFDIRKMVEGARKAMSDTAANVPFEQNPACQYAAARNALYAKGKKVEIMVNYTPKLHYVTEWWKQLYGESEGKENKGIFPAGVDFTTDLHSMGQYIQEGERFIFETVLSVSNSSHKLTIPEDPENLDQLNYIAGKRLSEVNHMAKLGTIVAHNDGGVPNIQISIPELSEYWIGYLLYFFERACAISGYTIDVNPFDQPGVEAYKKNMFALLGKPGFEEQGAELRKRLGI